MKILLLTDGVTPFVLGGMSKHSANLAKYLTLTGVEVALVHCVASDVDIPSDEKLNNYLFGGSQKLYKIICLKFPSMAKFPGHYLKESYRYSELVFEKIKEELNEYDFVYAKGFSAWKLLHNKSKGMKSPPVGVKFHGYEMFQKPPSFRSKIESFFLRKPVKWNTVNADYVFSYGAKITDIILGMGVSSNNIIEISSGIDNEWLRKKKLTVNNVVKFIFLGRYERRKGIEELSCVLNNLVLHENFEFHFIGPIPLNKQIKSKKIFYHGTVQEKVKLFDLLDLGDVLVCPSYSEGMPNVILEGMARGLAIVATDVGAVQLLVSKKNGILLNNCNEILIREAIRDVLLMDKNSILNMKENSIQIIKENFLWQNIIFKLLHSLDI